MRRSQNTSILHMPLQIPKLLQANPAHINNIRRRHDGGILIRPRHARARRHHEAQQVLVQREETEETLGDGG